MIQAYGLSFPDGTTPATVELFCFAHGWAREQSGLSRYQHYRNAVDLLWNIPRRVYAAERKMAYDPDKNDLFIWNEWTELISEQLCIEKEVLIAGPGACVSGDTRIWNPVSGESLPIAELVETQTAPIVMTTDGPEQACVPFLKGVDDLFEVILDSGNRFTATTQHRVLTKEGYVFVGSLAIGSRLFGYERIPQYSTADIGLLIHGRDARYSRKTVGDFQVDCRHDFCCGDAQPLLEEAAVRSSVPSPTDVHRCNRFSWCLDVPALAALRTLRESRCGHLSNSDFFLSDFHAGNPGLLRTYPETDESSGALIQPFSRFESRKPLHSPISKLTRHASSRRYQTYLPCYRIQQDTVSSITRAGTDSFYDITVPIAHHYFAEGAIHHNSWKSTAVAVYGNVFWFSSPHNTRVVCTSTTSDALRAKFWKEIQHFYRLANTGLGNPVPSRTIIQYQKGDDGAGIYGVAVESDGSVERAVNKIVGRHNTNIFVAVDELATVSEAIVEASVNLETGAEHFQFAGMANPDSKFDPHGRMSEPENGWNSITDETQMWRTKRGGVAIHLDGRRSPRIRDDEKFPGMIRQRDLDRTADIYGENSPQFWKQRVGFWCPEGITKTVLSETMIQKFRAMEKVAAGGALSWVSEFTQAAVLDPSFEGQDRKVLRFPKWGAVFDSLTGQTRKAIDLGEYIILKVDVTLPEPIHYQIVRQVKQACETRGIPPELFALDSTGEGGGLASIFAREWSPAIVMVEFKGRASERPVSEINPRTCREEYCNRVTELWFAVRTMMQNAQVYGLDKDTAIEFCKRLWEMRGLQIMVETKIVMKARTGKSPDLADTAAIACELFRQKEDLSFSGFVAQDDRWEKFRREQAALLDVEHEYLVEN